MKLHFAIIACAHRQDWLNRQRAQWWRCVAAGDSLAAYGASFVADGRDDYSSATDKQFAAISHCHADVDWLVISDDDTWFHIANLRAFLETLDQEAAAAYGQRTPPAPGERNVPNLHGGAGFALSRAAVGLLRESLDHHGIRRPSAHSDANLCSLLFDLKIPVVHNGYFRGATWPFYTGEPMPIRQISLHKWPPQHEGILAGLQ